MTQEQLEEAEYLRLRAKRHLLGNITLIGELFKLQMLSERIMHAWYVLLKHVAPCAEDAHRRIFWLQICGIYGTRSLHEFLSNLANPDEADVECLCNLLKTIGKQVRRRTCSGLAERRPAAALTRPPSPALFARRAARTARPPEGEGDYGRVLRAHGDYDEQ